MVHNNIMAIHVYNANIPKTRVVKRLRRIKIFFENSRHVNSCSRVRRWSVFSAHPFPKLILK